MTSIQGPIRIEPSLQNYAWGDLEIIQGLLGLPFTGEPVAEAWFGAHPIAPAKAVTSNEEVLLNSYIDRQSDVILGNELKRQFGTLPYLMKILAAKQPLSIQVHPNKTQAKIGFEQEEKAGIPLDAHNRSYRDTNHKPEILVALTPFFALAGFRDHKDILESLEQHVELTRILSIEETTPSGLREAIGRFFALPNDVVEFHLGSLIRKLQRTIGNKKFDSSSREHWLLRIHRHTSRGGAPDRGLIFVFLLEILSLEPGQAIFLPAGVLHAYLEGAGVEVMASSDNVIRAGLTSKHINIPELLNVVRFDALAPAVLDPVPMNNICTTMYPVPSTEIQLERIELRSNQSISRQAYGPETVLVTSSRQDVRVQIADQQISLRVGQASMIPHNQQYVIEASSNVELLITGVPAPIKPSTLQHGHVSQALLFDKGELNRGEGRVTDLEAYINTLGFLHYLINIGDAVPGSRVAFAHDLGTRVDNPKRGILQAIAKGIENAGMVPIYCGFLPTPALVHYGRQQGWPSIMVMGNGRPFDRNGTKFNKSNGEILDEDESGILNAIAQVRRCEYARHRQHSLFDGDGGLSSESIAPLPYPNDEAKTLYTQRYLTAFPVDSLKGATIGLYEHSAVGRDIIFSILSQLGAKVHRFGRCEAPVATEAQTESTPEDSFSSINDSIEALEAKVGHLDAVVSTDCDGTHPLLWVRDLHQARVFVRVRGDLLGLMVAHALEADAIALPISSPDTAELHFSQKSVFIERTRVDHSWIISTLRKLPGRHPVAWDNNGGFLNGAQLQTEAGHLESLPTRDAVLPIITALRTACLAQRPLGELLQTFPPRYSETGLRSGVLQEENKYLTQMLAAPKPYLRNIRFQGTKVEATTHGGQQTSLSSQQIGLLYILRSRISSVFNPKRGFGHVTSIDYLDGVRITFGNGDIVYLRPSCNDSQLRIYATADSSKRAKTIVDEGIRESRGTLRELLELAKGMNFTKEIKQNIANMEMLFNAGEPAKVLSIVSGSASSQQFWEQRLNDIESEFKARSTHSFHEDLPVNQAFGILLLWQRLRPKLTPGDSALIAFVFGDGTRSTPFTETECGQKPAMTTFVRSSSPHRPFRSTVELALRTFAPVEAYLRRSGFDGIVVKWGDEIQIPTRDLSGSDPLFAGADIVRFVSMQTMTEDTAKNKDWVAVNEDGLVRGFIPRRPLSAMDALADRGILTRQGKQLIGGINLGSIGLSRALLNILLETFETEVNDPTADRKQRPDLDPQLFSALMVATIKDPIEREHVWRIERQENPALQELETQLPGVVTRIRGALDAFEKQHGRPIRIVAMDFGDQYWGDVGQHHSMYSFYMALAQNSPVGEVARALAGLSETRDANGNILAGNTQLGERVVARNSVFIDAQIDEGEIDQSVLIGTRAGRLEARKAFDVQSTVKVMHLSPRSGTYKVVSQDPIHMELGGRATTVFLPDGEALYRISEDTPLKGSASAYAEPVFENPLSFRETHKIVTNVDPETTERLRINKREEVEAVLVQPTE